MDRRAWLAAVYRVAVSDTTDCDLAQHSIGCYSKQFV